jgi:hypothetical protein
MSRKTEKTDVLPWRRTCQNPGCESINKAVVSKTNTGERLCGTCLKRWKKLGDKGEGWRKGRVAAKGIPKNKLCQNKHCESTTKGLAGCTPQREYLCHTCLRRWKDKGCKNGDNSWRFGRKTRSKEKDAQRRRELQIVKDHREKHPEPERVRPKKILSDNDSSIAQPVPRKVTSMGPRSQRRQQPERDKCDSCFNDGRFCEKQDNPTEPCIPCLSQGRGENCRPIKLDNNGEIPKTRRWKTTPVQYQVPLESHQKCRRCQTYRQACDVVLPIDPTRPCTHCAVDGKPCTSKEHWEDAKDFGACRSCTSKGRGWSCDRYKPCGNCKEFHEDRCHYLSTNKERRIRVLLKPCLPSDSIGKNDKNTDWYNEAYKGWCQACVYKRIYSAQRPACQVEPDKPCWQCVRRNTDAPDRSRWCRQWLSSGVETAIRVSIFKIDENGVVVRRTPDEVQRMQESRPQLQGGEEHSRHRQVRSGSPSSSDSEEVEDIYSAESRAKTRDRLMSIKLRSTF